ncbi:MAG: flagellar assembly protein FliW, partial [Fidelibacterota bacterium]
QYLESFITAVPEQSQEQTSKSDWVETSEPLDFPAGLPGFEEHKQFILESRADLRPFLWLRSNRDREVAFPVISCLLLKKQVLNHISEKQLELLDNTSRSDIAPYYILRVDPTEGTITVNTKAPVIISTKTMQGYQVILDHEDLSVDVPLSDLLPSSGGA